MSTKIYDIAIVGAGLAGLTMALSLRHLSFRLALIDTGKKQDSITTEKSLVLSWTSHNVLRALDLWSTLAPASCAIETIQVSRQKHFQKTCFKAKQVKLPALGYSLAIKTLYNCLKQQVFEQKNLSYVDQCEVKGFSREADVISLQVLRQGQANSINCRFVIAADGVNSKLRSLNHIASVSPNTTERMAMVTRVQTQKALGNTAFERFTDTETLAVIPRADYQAGFIVSADKARVEHLLKLRPTERMATLQKQFGYFLGQLQAVADWQSYPIQTLYAHRQVQPGFVLLGNAAHNLSPVAAQGFNLTLRDIAVLAELLTEKAAVEPAALAQLVLSDYTQKRRLDQIKLMAATEAIEQTQRLGVLGAVIQELVYSGLNYLPGVKRQFIREMTGLAAPGAKLLAGIPLQ